jgi:uncharacterized protein YjdB
MSNKRIPIGNRPVTASTAETWVRQDEGTTNGSTTSRADMYTARLTIDVTPALRGRIKMHAFRQSVTVANLLRELLEREFPDLEKDT